MPPSHSNERPDRPRPPIIAITADVIDRSGRPTLAVSRAYADAVTAAGGMPVFIGPPDKVQTDPEATAAACLDAFDGFVLTGGDDPRTEPFGVPTDPRITPVHPDRQAFETELLRALETSREDAPVLGVCLGMQMMALVAGGELDQHMPGSTDTHAEHWERDHAIESSDPLLPSAGTVHSKHKQAIRDPGSLAVTANAHDGIVEAVRDTRRRWYLGVQWHPERTADRALGQKLFDDLVAAAKA